MRIAWATDVHLNFCQGEIRAAFYRELRGSGADAVLVTGDIAEAESLEELLLEMVSAIAMPLYFVLGNHDFYGSGIREVRRRARGLTTKDGRLRWLADQGVVSLSAGWGLVGHDGWADGRFGDWWHSNVVVNDYLLIHDLAGARFDRAELLLRIQALAGEAARHLRELLRRALEVHRYVLVGTHVPPFREACWHEGRISGDEWLPHFSSKVVGDVLLEAAEEHRHSAITVVCGHTHGEGVAVLRPNLTVLTGGADYGRPRLQRVFELE